MMDGDLNWVWWLLIAFVVMSMFKGGKHDRRHRRMQEQLDKLHQAPPPPAPAPQLRSAAREDVERLEQRVRVLERIVTDGGYGLASQIEALRDPEPIAARRKSEIEERI